MVHVASLATVVVVAWVVVVAFAVVDVDDEDEEPQAAMVRATPKSRTGNSRLVITRTLSVGWTKTVASAKAGSPRQMGPSSLAVGKP